VFTTDLHGLHYKGRTISAAEAYQRALPWQRAAWFPNGPPAGKAGQPAAPDVDSYPAGVDQVDGASLTAAVAAGQRALAEGYGSPRADGLVPCTHCTKCDQGVYDLCHQPQGRPAARLAAALAEADRLDQAEADLLACQRAAFAWEVAHGRVL
jgi:hypothetical protein